MYLYNSFIKYYGGRKMEKLKQNKKLIIIAAVVIVLAIVAIVCAVVFSKPSYKKQISKFEEALKSEENMEKYLDKYADYRAIYAEEKLFDADVDKDDAKAVEKAFKSEYKKAKKKDYKDDEFVNNVKDQYKTFTSIATYYEGTEITVKDIGKAEKFEECPCFKEVNFTLEMKYNDNSQEVEMSALFYKGKFVTLYSK